MKLTAATYIIALASFQTPVEVDATELNRFSVAFDGSVEIASQKSKFESLGDQNTVKVQLADMKRSITDVVTTGLGNVESRLCEMAALDPGSAAAEVEKGKITSTSRSSVSFRLIADATATAGSAIICGERRGFFKILKSKDIELPLPTMAVANATATIPIRFNEDELGQKFELNLGEKVAGTGRVSYQVKDADGKLLVGYGEDKSRFLIEANSTEGYVVNAQYVVSASGSDTPGEESRGIADIKIELAEPKEDTPVLEFKEAFPEPLIAGGYLEAGFEQVVAITQNNQPHCTGTIIGKRTVLTAAHCMKPYAQRLRFFKVHVANDINRPIQTRNILSIDYPNGEVMGFNYDSNIHADDIALIYVDRMFTRENGSGEEVAIRPLLVHSGKPSLGDIRDDVIDLQFTGFGYTDSQGTSRGFKRSVFLSPIEISSKTFKNKSAVRKTCRGDSGGPALYIDDNNVIVVGIVSQGISLTNPGQQVSKCKTYGFNTRVETYVNWINKRIDKPSKGV